jgi:hypothetical protein
MYNAVVVVVVAVVATVVDADVRTWLLFTELVRRECQDLEACMP